MFLRALIAISPFVAAGCADIPRDPDGTLKRVLATGEFKVGIVSPGADVPDLGKQKLLLARVAEQTGAQPEIATGASERLLAQLEEGELDLVIGEFAEESPWRKRVTMLPPLEKKKSEAGETQLGAAAQNGENRWIGLLYRQGRAISGGES